MNTNALEKSAAAAFIVIEGPVFLYISIVGILSNTIFFTTKTKCFLTNVFRVIIPSLFPNIPFFQTKFMPSIFWRAKLSGFLAISLVRKKNNNPSSLWPMSEEEIFFPGLMRAN
jgi:hypothetical protein